MKKLYVGFIAILFMASCVAQKPEQIIKEANVARIIKTLSSDEMEGRGTFTPGIDRAAKFIENEFKQIGLKPLSGDTDFRQDFSVKRIKAGEINVTINGKPVDQQNVLAISDLPSLKFNNTSGNIIIRIAAGEQFIQRYREISALKTEVLVLVDTKHAALFKRLKDNSSRGRIQVLQCLYWAKLMQVLTL
jgi:hypothetical protein